MGEVKQADEGLVDIDHRTLSACAALFVETFNGPPWNDAWTLDTATVRLQAMLDTPGSVAVALVARGLVTGAAFSHVEQWFTGRHLHLQEMFVRVDLQRQGRGERLLAGLGRRCPDVEASYLITDRDVPAAAFYERNGFSTARSRIVMTRTH